MATSSRVKFNPVTKEIEIEGSEKFVKAYFDKVQKILSGPRKEVKAKRKAKKTATPQKAKKSLKMKKSTKAAKKPTAKKKPAKRESLENVVTLIKESAGGITTTQLKEKTGLTDQQIWGAIYRAQKQGKVKKAKRGVYVAV